MNSSSSLDEDLMHNANMREENIVGVYIMGNNRPTLYVGVTNCLPRRIWEHKHGKGSVFTKKYNLTKLLYYEYCETIFGAIVREKQIKKMLRNEKLHLIKTKNPIYADISAEIFEGCDFS